MRALITINCSGVDASAAGGVALGRRLAGQGHTVLIQAERGGSVEKTCLEEGLDVTGASLKGAAILTGFIPFSKLVHRFEPDIICTTRADGQTAASLLFPRKPLIRIRCDIRPPRGGRIWNLVDRRTDLVVFPSDFMLRRGYARGRTGPVAVIPHPVDTDRYRPSTPGAPLPRRLLSIGRLSPVKGHRTLIRALALLPGVNATIAGPPSQQLPEDLMSYASKLGVADRLTLTGTKVDVMQLIKKGGVGLVTSLGSEVVSRAGMEMMSAGMPLLAAATNGLLDLVTDGDTGFLHSPGNAKQLAAQAAYLLDNPEVADRLSRNARRFCVERLDTDVIAQMWSVILDAVVNGEQHPAMRVPHMTDNKPEGW